MGREQEEAVRPLAHSVGLDAKGRKKASFFLFLPKTEIWTEAPKIAVQF